MDGLGLNLTDAKLFPSARHHSTGQYLGSNIIRHGFFARLLFFYYKINNKTKMTYFY